MIVRLPHKFKPRDYQREALDAFFKDKVKRFVDIEHRRAGKDKKWWNITLAASQERIGTYVYCLPTLVQAREVIWEGIDRDGFRILDHIASELIEGRPNNSEMSIKFKNGSRLRLGGSDHFSTLIGSNPIGFVFSEFSLQNPLAWDYLRPILLENGGWAAFIYTPRGSNHGFELYNMAKDNEDWFCKILTVDDTKLDDGSPVFTKAMIQSERDAGMSEDMILQEYYCSFSAAIRGAYFSLQFKEIEVNNNILDYAIDRSIAVTTAWDIGVGDSTAIWLIQEKQDSTFDVIYYYENDGLGVAHYINKLDEIRRELGITYSKHLAPHDIAKRDFNTGKSHVEYARDLGFTFERVPRVKHKEYAIEASRSVLPRCRFHETNCKHGIRCLKEYHKKYNARLNIYSDEPDHDWSSNSADAFSSFSLVKANLRTNAREGIRFNCVNTGRLL